jgi:hypothetical protein
MNVIKYLSLATSFLLLTSPLQAVDAVLKELTTKSQLTEEGISSLGDQLRTCRSHHCRPHRGHHKSRAEPAFLYASTPLDYVGQNVGTAPVASGTTVPVNFPVIGDTSRVLPVSENEPGIFTVLENGQYLINWSTLVLNSDAGGFNVAFEIVLSKNGNPQPPNLKFHIPPAFGKENNPSGESLSGSILLPLEVGDIVQLNITSLSSSNLPIPIVVGSAAINFIRISEK